MSQCLDALKLPDDCITSCHPSDVNGKYYAHYCRRTLGDSRHGDTNN